MRFEIRHITTYRFASAVFLEPHVIRLIPSTDPGQRLLRFSCDVQPPPAGTSEVLDLEGNCVLVCWFEDLVSDLVISATSEVETLRENPFAYLPLNGSSLPYQYSGGLLRATGPFLEHRADPDVRRLGERVSSMSGGAPDAFLSMLASEIQQQCQLIVRPEGEPRPADETLALREGSCRDLAMVFIDVCRSQGLAARFVSGYHAVLGEGEQDLHAWAETYIEGGGWRGFDPTNGLAVGPNHVAVARAASPSQAAPVTGSYRGSALATLSSSLAITSTSENG